MALLSLLGPVLPVFLIVSELHRAQLSCEPVILGFWDPELLGFSELLGVKLPLVSLNTGMTKLLRYCVYLGIVLSLCVVGVGTENKDSKSAMGPGSNWKEPVPLAGWQFLHPWIPEVSVTLDVATYIVTLSVILEMLEQLRVKFPLGAVGLLQRQHTRSAPGTGSKQKAYTCIFMYVHVYS